MAVSTTKDIELNDQFKRALDVMENTQKHVFVTGRAGTGKSTLLDYFRNTTRKKVVVLAPTGVAAVNVQGQTIHSFFRFKPGVTVRSVRRYRGRDRNIYKAIETIVIDEISMVRADLLDCVDRFLRLNGKNRNNPFGGTQMIFIGDLYQLPPVVRGKEEEIFRKQFRSQYFFDAKVFEDFEMAFIELEKVYRQKDKEFIDILNAIRNNSVTDKDLKALNGRLDAGFEANPDQFYITLTTTNKLSAEKNENILSKLATNPLHYRGKIVGKFGTQYLPTDVDLRVKVGSQIMMVNNDSEGRWVNGTVGRIVDVEKSEEGKDIMIVELADGNEVDVEPYTWKLFNLYYNKETGSLDSEVVGSFTQYPLRLAWAVTIHKSQGKTFDRVIIDIGSGTFSHGQVYVALSRCTSLDGIVLKKPIQKKHIFMDWKVVNFLTKYQYKLSDRNCSLEEKIRVIKRAIENKSNLDIVYLRPNDEKSRRVIRPKRVGKMEYLGKSYVGVEGFCFLRQDDRVFRVDRILEMKEVKARR